MKLRINHYTQYNYENPVVDSVNELRLTPITDEHQTCCEHKIMIKPSVPLYSYTDYFGNLTHFFTLNKSHKLLLIKMDAIVETKEPKQEELPKIPYEDELNILKDEQFQNKFAEYLMETDYTVITAELEEFVRNNIHLVRSKNTYELLEHISNSIYVNFTYDKEATNVHTTIKETLHLKRGVCQDYAHLMIGICRIFNIPARYVSGYHFIGDIENEQADIQHASHAWVEAFIPSTGWIGFDPTNNGTIDCRYVKISHGRDYSDIAPVKGVYKGSGNQSLHVFVDIQYVKE